MKALTVQQPWAWSIFHAGKDVENRTAWWSHTGELAIHAGARTSERGFEQPEYMSAMAWHTAAVRHQVDVRSAITGVVHVAAGTHVAEPGCCTSLWAEQSYVEHGGRERKQIVHYALTDQVVLPEPIAIKGRLGLWTVPDWAEHAIREQLAA